MMYLVPNYSLVNLGCVSSFLVLVHVLIPQNESNVNPGVNV